MKLMLAMDIADRLREVASSARPFDIESEARHLIARHPEAHVTVNEVIETLTQEIRITRRPMPEQVSHF
ncbi:hypothetical protein [Pelagibacterium lacus]|nr:hypothetical protein [Pelagibacterium lacus]